MSQKQNIEALMSSRHRRFEGVGYVELSFRRVNNDHMGLDPVLIMNVPGIFDGLRWVPLAEAIWICFD